MKKSKFLIIVIMSIVMLFAMAIIVYAADDTGTDTEDDGDGTTEELTWTDGSKIKFEVKDDTSVTNMHAYKLEITGEELIEDHSYYVYITNSKTHSLQTDDQGIPSGYATSFESSNGEALVNLDKFLQKNGDVYAWVYESQSASKTESGKGRTQKLIVSAYKVERPTMNPLGLRMRCNFNEMNTQADLWEWSDILDRKINLKIGKVTDTSILNSIKNGESDCLDKLLSYAKSSASIYTGTVPLGVSDSITSEMDLTDGAYYFVYMELEDEDGTYYPVEDVSLYQALVSDSGIVILYDYLSEGFSWKLDGDSQSGSSSSNNDDSTSTASLPKTGTTLVFIIVGAITILEGTVAYMKCRKYRDI